MQGSGFPTDSLSDLSKLLNLVKPLFSLWWDGGSNPTSVSLSGGVEAIQGGHRASPPWRGQFFLLLLSSLVLQGKPSEHLGSLSSYLSSIPPSPHCGAPLIPADIRTGLARQAQWSELCRLRMQTRWAGARAFISPCFPLLSYL